MLAFYMQVIEKALADALGYPPGVITTHTKLTYGNNMPVLQPTPDELILDDISLVDMVLNLEERLNIEIPDECVGFGEFMTIEPRWKSVGEMLETIRRLRGSI